MARKADDPLIHKLSKRFCFYQGTLYYIRFVDRPNDIAYVFNMPEQKEQQVIWSAFQRGKTPARRTSQVAHIINRSPSALRRNMGAGTVHTPPCYPSPLIGENNKMQKNRWWSEEDIIKCHAGFLDLQRGRTRKDGTIPHAQNLPTKREVIAMLAGRPILHIKGKNGQYVPVWKEKEW